MYKKICEKKNMKVFVHTILNLMVKISSKLHEENYFKIKKNWQKI
jgi:hypothetical protein